MANITSNDIRNICLLGHGGSGKTSLIEAALYYTKAIARRGKIEDKNTVCDYDPEELKRGFSISSSLAPVFFRDKKINFIDTPGYLDFQGEVRQALRVARNAIILINARAGVEAGTDIAWEAATEAGVARSFFINHMDEPDINYKAVIEDMKERYGNAVCPVIVPYYEGGALAGFINMIENVAYTYDKDGVRSEKPIPAEVEPELTEYKQMLNEALAETSDEMMEKFFADEPFTHDEMVSALNRGLDKGSIAPVFAGSAKTLAGVAFLLSIIYHAFPSPIAKGYERDCDGEKFEIKTEGPASVFVWKTVADQFVGKMSYIKVMSGVLKREDLLKNMNTGNTEKVVHLYSNRGKENTHIDELICGDLGVITKLQGVNTNDTLNVSADVKFKSISFPKPYLCLAVKPKAKGDEDKVTAGITKLLEEDRTVKYEVNSETKQILLYGLGEMHLDVIVSKLKNRFGVDVELVPQKIAYREAIKKSVDIQGKYKKQSGGHGQYGDVWIKFSPGEADGLTFTESVVGGAVPKNFFPAVEKGLL
ncbi:MAG: elongation factor G, partial [Firmicutes bacterium]|nr:elongation factor G [Bacillota bacterium]